MTLGRQCIQELLIARRAENAFSQASRPRLPDGPPDGLDQAGRPVLTRHLGEQLVDHPLQQFKLRPSPPSGEEGRGYLRPVHERAVHMVQHVMEHSQIHGHHLRNNQKNRIFNLFRKRARYRGATHDSMNRSAKGPNENGFENEQIRSSPNAIRTETNYHTRSDRTNRNSKVLFTETWETDLRTGCEERTSRDPRNAAATNPKRLGELGRRGESSNRRRHWEEGGGDFAAEK